MPFFRFTQQEIDRAVLTAAEKAVEAREREAAEAAACPQSGRPASSPAPAQIITAADAAALGIEPGDPYLQSLEAREVARRPGNEPKPGPAPARGTEPKTSSAPAGQEVVRRYEDNILQILSNVPAATRREIGRIVHADRHPQEFKAAWQSLRRAGSIIETDQMGRRRMWRRPDGK
jgi:hypothetical protein